ncbi:MAG: SdpI family protein [Polyangiaceae bacterium]
MSTNKNFKVGWDVASLTMVAGTTLISWKILPSLPPVIATHFDIHGNPNGFSSREFGAFLLPILSLVVWAILRFAMLAAPKAWRAKAANAPMAAMGTLTVAFLSGLHFAVLNAALNGGSGLGRELAVLLGGMWIALGILLPRMRRNPLIGIRTAWTLSSDENWARTHRVASYTFLVGGVLCLGGGLLGTTTAIAIAIVTVIVSALIPTIYSWSIARHT